MKRDWSDFFKQELESELSRVKPQEELDQDALIDRLLDMPLEDAFLIIVENVPSLDNDDWVDFQRGLAARAQDNQHAYTLLKMAHMMVEAENKVREILNMYNVVGAATMTKGLLEIQNKSEQFTLLAFLHYLSKSDPKARAVLGLLLD